MAGNNFVCEAFGVVVWNFCCTRLVAEIRSDLRENAWSIVSALGEGF